MRQFREAIKTPAQYFKLWENSVDRTVGDVSMGVI